MALNLNGIHDDTLGRYNEGERVIGTSNFLEGDSNNIEEDETPLTTADIVLIWSCIGLVCVVWCTFAIYSAYSGPLRRVQASEPSERQENKKELPREKRRALILAHFAQTGNQMEVTTNHFTHPNTESNPFPSSNLEANANIDIEACNMKEGNEIIIALPRYDEEDPGTLVLRGCDETPNADRPAPAQVANCCAICLESYNVKDMIVWSCTESCPHVYHQNCFNDYLVFYKGKGSPCPTCRQKFCSTTIFSAANANKKNECMYARDSATIVSSSMIDEGGGN